MSHQFIYSSMIYHPGDEIPIELPPEIIIDSTTATPLTWYYRIWQLLDGTDLAQWVKDDPDVIKKLKTDLETNNYYTVPKTSLPGLITIIAYGFDNYSEKWHSSKLPTFRIVLP
jgi:hypothetical protein